MAGGSVRRARPTPRRTAEATAVGRRRSCSIEQDKVDEVANPGVLAVAEVAEHGVELLGSMAVDVDDLDGSSPGYPRSRGSSAAAMRSVTSSSWARGEMSSWMRPNCLPARWRVTPTRHVGCRHRPRTENRSARPATITNPSSSGSTANASIQTFLEVGRVGDLVAEPEVDVLGQPGVVAEANLQRHPAFEDPPARLGGLEAGHDALEQDTRRRADRGRCRSARDRLRSRCSKAPCERWRRVVGQACSL